MVESFRGPWSPLDGEFHDPGVARDQVLTFEPRFGSTIVRCESSPGPGARGLSGVVGDWLCGADGPNFLLPVGSLAGRWADGAWAKHGRAIDLWESCPEPELLVGAAASDGVGGRPVVAAACACVREAFGSAPAATEEAAGALLAAEAWVRGGLPAGRLGGAYVQARSASMLDEPESGRRTAQACAYAASAAWNYERGSARERRTAAADAELAVRLAAEVVASGPGGSAPVHALRRMLDAVRASIPSLAYLSALRPRPRRAPPD